MPLRPQPSRWRWGLHGLAVAFVASLATNAAVGGKAALVVLVVLLLANGAAIEAGRAPRR